jgi:hypothetical protein
LGASEFKQAMLDASVLAGMRGYNGAKSNVWQVTICRGDRLL